MVERLIVKDRVVPSIQTEELFDQYDFKKTVCTTAAIIDITHKICILLETKEFVRCLLIDFSKAFDSVDHIILINKLKSFNISHNVIQWIVSFLMDRTEFVKMGKKWPYTRAINRSIVQGSGIGPTVFVTCIIDLKPIGSTNYVTKYADDASLLIPEKCDIDSTLEFQNMLKWAINNKFTINMARTKELVFHRPNARNYLPSVALPGIDRVICAKPLAVWLQDDLGLKEHVNNLMLLCNQRTDYISQLKRQGYRRNSWKMYLMQLLYRVYFMQHLRREAI